MADRYAEEFAAAKRWVRAERKRRDRSAFLNWEDNDAYIVASHSPFGIRLHAWLIWKRRTPLWKRAIARVWHRLGHVHPCHREFLTNG